LAGLSLTALDVSDTAVGDAGLAKMTRWDRMSFLCLNGTGVTDGALARLAGAPKLTYLSLERTRVTDGGMESVAKLPAIDCLFLERTAVTDAGVAKLAGLSLYRFSLAHTGITDEAMRSVGAMVDHSDRGLVLDLTGTRVTDAGLRQLEGRKHQMYLVNVTDTLGTTEGVERLKRRVPGVRVVR
jgi:hypothetical protein